MEQSAVPLFALEGSRAYGERAASQLAWPLSPHEERAFEDGDHKARPLVDVNCRDVFVIHSLAASTGSSPSDRLCRLLFFVGALKDAGARRVRAAVPYVCYARKDQRSQTSDPITTKYVARMCEACGADAIITLDVHNRAAYENAFRIPTTNIEAMSVFVAHLAARLRGEKLAVVSSDVGGTKRAERFRRMLTAAMGEEPNAGFVEKQRAGGIVTGELFVGDVRGRTVILFDDMIATGTTLCRAAAKCREARATRVFAAATHGLFLSGVPGLLRAGEFDGVVVDDTVQSDGETDGLLPETVTILETATLLGEAIVRSLAGL